MDPFHEVRDLAPQRETLLSDVDDCLRRILPGVVVEENFRSDAVGNLPGFSKDVPAHNGSNGIGLGIAMLGGTKTSEHTFEIPERPLRDLASRTQIGVYRLLPDGTREAIFHFTTKFGDLYFLDEGIASGAGYEMKVERLVDSLVRLASAWGV